jgi:predicted DNA-binding protein YlxM (UPF0122 family)
MNKQERAERLKEMRRFYFEKNWTLRQIADYYKVTIPAIYYRFTRNGIKLQRNARKPQKTVEREILFELYEKMRLPVTEIAVRLKISYPTIIKELKRHGIKYRPQCEKKYKFPAIRKLEIGEKLIVPRPPVKQPHKIFYYHANVSGIKISVKSIGDKTLQITRIE